MSLNFTDGVTEYAYTTAVAADKRFGETELWTVLAIGRISNSADDERTIIAKWGDPSNTRQFVMRTAKTAAPTNIQIYTDAILSLTGTANKIALNTWYVFAATNDGTGLDGGLKFYLIDMSGAVIDYATGEHEGDGIFIQDITIGGRTDSAEAGSDIDYVCYIEQVLTQEQIVAYSQNPYKLAMSLQDSSGNVAFFNKLGHGGINCIDLSGQGRTWSIQGTLAVSDSPPVAPLFGWNTELPYEVVVGGEGADIRNHIIPAYMRINA